MDNDDITFDISSLIENNITIDVSTVNIGHIGDIHLNTIDNQIYIHNGTTWDTINVESIDEDWQAVEWENSYPDFAMVSKMCKEYPALEKALENFKTIYKMVEQDWRGKTKDDPPF